MTNIHPTSLIEEGAKIGKGVTIGPFCVVSKDTILDDNVELKSHVYLSGKVFIGKNTSIYSFVSIGCVPQNRNDEGKESAVSIGQNNIIREHVTIHRGTDSGNIKTIIGNNCFIMVGAHIAHDCVIGDNVTMANNATLGGHVVLENFVVLGGLVAIHQFVRIGECSMIGGMSGVKYDVPPFSMLIAPEPNMEGINVVGMKRRNLQKSDRVALKSSYELLFNSDYSLSEAVDLVESKFASNEVIDKLIKFIKSDSIRGIRKPNYCYGRIKV